MKLILTGVTGFIGGEVLSQCLRNSAITSVVALSRRELNDVKNSKLEVVVVEDFSKYPESILKKLSGADACIWCMGTTAGNRVLEVDYPLAFGNAMSNVVQAQQKKFRYLHLSGAATERDQEKALWFKGDMRKMKGEAEVNMLELPSREGNAGLWETVIIKAGFVVSKEVRSPRDMLSWVLGTKNSIQVDELAAAMIDVAMHGSEENTLKDNYAMVIKGREALKAVE